MTTPMKILRKVEVPTGHIMVGEGKEGPLEFLSIGDYGKDHNLKCDAMGLDRDFEGPIKHAPMLPLTEKWVITISPQYGCSVGCTFCDVPKVGPGVNATLHDMQQQVIRGLELHPEITSSRRLNIHFARMGEPTFNPEVLDAAAWFFQYLNPRFRVHPVVSTMMPRQHTWLKTFVHAWMNIKNWMYQGNAGLQLSINSTNEKERTIMFGGGCAHTLDGIARIMHGIVPFGRKITLNFAVAGYEIDPDVLLKYFDPALYIIKLTPMHKTVEALENGIKTAGDYTTFHPYQEHEAALKAAGYDVLVFIASLEEDLGRITCGNAILSGTKPEVEYTEL
jgi:23S rRNA (adenine2503-C2)-methyltransferase